MRAMYALFDSDAATLTFQRVPYDHIAAAAAARATHRCPCISQTDWSGAADAESGRSAVEFLIRLFVHTP